MACKYPFKMLLSGGGSGERKRISIYYYNFSILQPRKLREHKPRKTRKWGGPRTTPKALYLLAESNKSWDV
ncbi:uncharacterized protein METZ01_LOCUS54331 [marine metagenome]|uniref:Uncharacterized protein n=1 Tax=marine metagenome TaxID=408172 RepID=A0A381SGN9_9ZZZZ